MDRYIGLDTHASSCTLAVVGPSGKRLGSHVVETNARAVIEVIHQIPPNRHLCLEEGTLAGWLYEVLEPHVQEIVVAGVGTRRRGPKNDKGFVVGNVVRVKNRLKSLLRSRGVGYGVGSKVYSKTDREHWLQELPEAAQPLVELHYHEHDALVALKAKAEKALLAEAHKHRQWRLLRTCPGMAPTRIAELDEDGGSGARSYI